jgi:hypothetical protein
MNFGPYGRAESREIRKLVLRAALPPNQIKFSHSLGHKPTSRKFCLVASRLEAPCPDCRCEPLTHYRPSDHAYLSGPLALARKHLVLGKFPE